MTRRSKIEMLLAILGLAALALYGRASHADFADKDRIIWHNARTGQITKGATGSWGPPTADPIPAPDYEGAIGVQSCGIGHKGDLDIRNLWLCECSLERTGSRCDSVYVGNPPLVRASRGSNMNGYRSVKDRSDGRLFFWWPERRQG